MSTEAEAGSSGGSGARFLRAAIDGLFPTRCLACGERPVEDAFAGAVCRACWRSLPLLPAGRCRVCDESLPSEEAPAEDTEERAGATCGRCILDAPPFRRLRAAVPYRGSARAILIAFKFRGADFLAGHLARAMTRDIGAEARALEFDEVVPVPGNPLSRWGRDHPAERLAEAVAGRLGLPFAAGRLRKTRRTQKQSGLPARDRPANVRGAFAASPYGRSRPRILLVDDVATSGATARECSSALRRAGAATVDVWCFARATRDDEIAAAADDAMLRRSRPGPRPTDPENGRPLRAGVFKP